MTHDIDGDATFTNVPAPFAAAFPNQAASAGLAVPDIGSIHAMHRFNERWMLTADWSLFGFCSLR
jgi:hypothetical protein